MGDFYGQTTIHPLGLTAVLMLGVLMLLLPRRFAVIPMIVMACFIAPAQRIVILGADFNLLRIMVVFGFLRLLLRNEFQGLVMRPMDWVVITWVTTSTAAFTLLFGTTEALVNRLGFAFDALGMYFLFRCLIQGWSDLDSFVRVVILISVPVAIFFLLERSTGRNLFSVFGGVPEMTLVREGRMRCQGAFAHPILAGCFWAVMVPLIASRWWHGGIDRLLCAVGLCTALIIIYCCGSSTPVSALILAGLGMLMYSVRNYMRCIRWGLLLTVIGLHLVMLKPVWHLVGRLDFVGGSTGYHRYLLIDCAIRHVGDWWLVGIVSTAGWGDGLDDVTNQYVLEGVRGGLLTVVLFVVMISLTFAAAGRLWRMAPDAIRRHDAWSLGVVVFVHVMNFIGVSYFGQIQLLWYFALAAVTSLAGAQVPVLRRQPARHGEQRYTRAHLVRSPQGTASQGTLSGLG